MNHDNPHIHMSDDELNQLIADCIRHVLNNNRIVFSEDYYSIIDNLVIAQLATTEIKHAQLMHIIRNDMIGIVLNKMMQYKTVIVLYGVLTYIKTEN